MSLAQRASILLSLCAWLAFVCAVPSFEGVTYWHSDIGSLVPGMTALEALGPNNNYENGYFIQRHVAVPGEHGTPGNISIISTKMPPLFYINNDQLWLYHNASTILPVNIQNSTLSAKLPLQLVVGKKREGVKGGGWRWQGTQLVYDQGRATNSGVYYSCQDTNGLMGLFMFMVPSPTPAGCTIFTVHSFLRNDP